MRAESVSQLQPTGYVNDFAHVLNPSTTAQIDDTCRQIDQQAHAQITLVTINSLDGSDIDSYAVDLFKKWGIGAKSTDRGVLILYAIRDRQARIEVGYGLEPILPDGKVGGFQREAIPLMKSEDYNNALSLVTSRVAQVIATDAGIQLTGRSRRLRFSACVSPAAVCRSSTSSELLPSSCSSSLPRCAVSSFGFYFPRSSEAAAATVAAALAAVAALAVGAASAVLAAEVQVAAAPAAVGSARRHMQGNMRGRRRGHNGSW